MAIENQGAPGLDYETFKRRIYCEAFNPTQGAMIDIRIQLLENFMQLTGTPGARYVPQKKPTYGNNAKGKQAERNWYNEEDRKRKASIAKRGIWSFRPGTLTIVDLSCPFVDESAACALFNMCLSIFLDDRQDVGRIVALDEAHKVRFYAHQCRETVLGCWELTASSSCPRTPKLRPLQRRFSLSYASKGISQHESSSPRRNQRYRQSCWTCLQ